MTVKLKLTCVRCGKLFLRRKSLENYRLKRGSVGPYCSNSCSSRSDDPRLAKKPAPVRGAKWLQLTRGKFALVDNDLFEKLNKHPWHWNATGKSFGYVACDNGKTHTMLHHVVLGVSGRVHIDHRNNNGLDCRRENLRVANRQGNGANRGKFVGRRGRTFTSRYKGVINRSKHLSLGADPWLARIRVNGQLIHLGRFISEEEAARAYDRAALQHFGEFAKTNFPLEAHPS